MGFLHASRGWRTLPGGLGRKLLPWRFSSSRFTSSLLGTGHVVLAFRINEKEKSRSETATSIKQLGRNGYDTN